MKKTVITFFLVLSLGVIRSNSQDNIFLKIEGIAYDSAVIGFISEQNRDQEIEDVAIISNGQLSYKFNLQGLHEGIIIPFKLIHQFGSGDKFPIPSSRIHFYINQGEIIHINAVVEGNTVTYSTSGNVLSAQRAEADTYFRQTTIYKDRLNLEQSFFKKKMDQWTKEENGLYWEGRTKNNEMYALKREEYIKNNLHSAYTPRLILEMTDKQQVTYWYDKLSKEVVLTHYGRVLKDIVDGWDTTQPGLVLPDFNATTLEGHEFTLKDYRGKYVLLDFWGSWCAPCIAEVPELKKLESRFKDKLLIVGMVSNDSKGKALKSVEKHQIKWIQLFDEQNSFPRKYGVKNFPTKVLLDPDGKVIKTFEGTSKATFTELNEILRPE